MCGRFIAKNRSWILRLPVGILPQPERWDLNLRGGWYTPSGGVYDPETDGQRRAWVHHYCYADGLTVADPGRPELPAPTPAPRPVAEEKPALDPVALDAFRARMRAVNAADDLERARRIAAAKVGAE
jgi:hypothetical protein